MVSSSPAYGTVAVHSRQPIPQDDRTYSTVDSSQHETVATSGNSAYGTAFTALASAKGAVLFVYSNVSKSVVLIDWSR